MSDRRTGMAPSSSPRMTSWDGIARGGREPMLDARFKPLIRQPITDLDRAVLAGQREGSRDYYQSGKIRPSVSSGRAKILARIHSAPLICMAERVYCGNGKYLPATVEDDE